MNEDELLIELQRIIEEYITDTEMVEYLTECVKQLKIKHIIAEMDKNKNKEYSHEDRETIRDIYFCYC